MTQQQASNAFDLAKVGSNQLSLETPRNGVEYALGTMDKIVNWARQGSMWPMVRPPHLSLGGRGGGPPSKGLRLDVVSPRSPGSRSLTAPLSCACALADVRIGMLRRRDDAHGRGALRPGPSRRRLPCLASSGAWGGGGGGVLALHRGLFR